MADAWYTRLWVDAAPGVSVERFSYASTTGKFSMVFMGEIGDENIRWCHGHISRKEAAPLLAAAGLAGP